MKPLTLLLTLALTLSANAAELDPISYLNKISQRLTGQWPTPAEFDSLQEEMDRTGCKETSCLTSFFSEYINRKMTTPQFYSEAVLKVFEKFSFSTPEQLPIPLPSNIGSDDTMLITRMVTYRVFHENLSIDELFTGQTYWQQKDAGAFAQFANFSIQTVSEPPTKPLDSQQFPEFSGNQIYEVDYTNHPNISGLFSTNKFLERYWNTPVNANRKRAAAIYRIMLCDAMTPSLERDKQKDREEALASGKSEQQISQRTIEEIHKNRHANQIDCAKCHTRLDPVAQAMRPLELGISSFGVPGRLAFFNAVGERIEVPASNFHDLTVKATQYQRYADCQLNWLFNWIVGKDVAIHPQRFGELLDDFQESGRKVKTVISQLLRSPEFRGVQVKYDEPESLIKAREVFSNCAECHGSFFRMRGDQLKLKLYKISGKLDLAHGGRHRIMPPSDHWWAPSDQDLREVKSWLMEGAPLVKGKAPLLNPGEVNSVINQTGGTL